MGELVARQLGRHPGALRRIVVDTLRSDARAEQAITAALANDCRVNMRRVVDQPKARAALLQAMWPVSPALTHAIAEDPALAAEILGELVRELRANTLLAAAVRGELELEMDR